MDTALLFGAIIALLGIFAFGFLYIGTGDEKDSLMQNAQKMAKLGDAETLRNDLEKERTLRFGTDLYLL